MRYQYVDSIIPQEKRKEINEKLLFLIDNKQTETYGMTKQDVYNAYTGDGGLHGLSFSEFAHYNAYSSAKKEIEQGQFFTPHRLCEFLVNCIQPSAHDLIADLTAGIGNFLNWLPNPCNAYANEIDIKAYKIMRFLYPEAHLSADDIRFYDPKIRFDVIFGNPPFNLRWRIGDREEMLSQLYYCVKAHELLKPAGLLALIVPCSFMSDDFQDGGMIREMNERFHFIYQAALPADAFKAVGVEYFPTKIMFFQKASDHLPAIDLYRTELLVAPFHAAGAEAIYESRIRPVLDVKEKIKHKLFYENLKENRADAEFGAAIKKYLFDIKRNPKISGRYAACMEYVNRFATQTKPEGMKYDEWEKIRIKPEQVTARLRSVIRNQHEIEREEIRLVKTAYGLRLKGYSESTRLFLSRSRESKVVSFAEMVVSGEFPFADRADVVPYEKLFKRKLREYNRQAQPFEDMKDAADIGLFLSELVIHDAAEGRDIRLNPVQMADTNKLLQKRFGYLQWDTGSGKSVSAVAQMLYRLAHSSIRNIVVAAPAIAIQNNWALILESYGIGYRRIQRLADIEAIQPGEVVLISVNMLVQYQRFVKRFIYKQAKKVMLVLDEADIISNPQSRRTKAVLNCFRKLPFKILLSGTMTRNTIAEAAPQFELMYNNSVNMISEAERLYERDKEDPEMLKDFFNPYYMQPIPAYTAGYRLFSESHIPERITMFGIGQHTQDIYNADALKRLIGKSIITKSFKEVTGREPFEPHQHPVAFNAGERELYRMIMEEYYKMDHLFTSTGNLRRDRMFDILNQLLLMLRACTVPDSFREYEGGKPSKVVKMLALLDEWKGQQVAIGVRHINVVHAYAAQIRGAFPKRPLFVITGDRVTLKKRLQLVEQMKQHPDAILICTQQSLSCSMNIGFINKILIPELYWNDPAMSQFWARFIRYNSECPDKEVHFITCADSIECNLLGLIMTKQKLNLFMKSQEVEDEELYEKYGVDYNLLDMLIRKERDEDGRVQIRWGRQEIV